MIKEKCKNIPIYGSYEVIVVGGGIAGVSAALASARKGAKTLLIESQYMLGGLATAGLITYYLPLCDGNGHQLSYGIAEELLKLSISKGYENSYPSVWLDKTETEERKKVRYMTQFNANVFSILMEKELIKAGVEIFYGTTVCDVKMNEKKDRIQAVFMENRSGRSAALGKNFIDTTGDALLCKYAGEETEIYSNGNALAAWYYEYLDGEYKLNEVGARDTDEAYEIIGLYKGIEAKELSEVTIHAHQIILDRFLEKGNVGENHAIATIATIPQVRMTRRICGQKTMSITDEKKHVQDSIGMFGSWRQRGRPFEIPYGALIGKKVRNLAVAGRCISANDTIWDLTRVIPVCAVTGEAAGVAGARYEDFYTVDINELQDILRKDGGKIHFNEVGIVSLE